MTWPVGELKSRTVGVGGIDGQVFGQSGGSACYFFGTLGHNTKKPGSTLHGLFDKDLDTSPTADIPNGF